MRHPWTRATRLDGRDASPPSPETELAAREGVVVAVSHSAGVCDQCYRLEGSGPLINAKGGGVLGKEYALWHALATGCVAAIACNDTGRPGPVTSRSGDAELLEQVGRSVDVLERREDEVTMHRHRAVGVRLVEEVAAQRGQVAVEHEADHVAVLVHQR